MAEHDKLYLPARSLMLDHVSCQLQRDRPDIAGRAALRHQGQIFIFTASHWLFDNRYPTNKPPDGKHASLIFACTEELHGQAKRNIPLPPSSPGTQQHLPSQSKIVMCEPVSPVFGLIGDARIWKANESDVVHHYSMGSRSGGG